MYAFIVDGAVRELIPDADAPLEQRYPAAFVAACVPVPADLTGQVAERWTWSAEGGFAPPVPVTPPAIRIIRTLAFRRRLSAETRAAITLAASQALDGGDAQLQVFLDDLAASREVELDDPELIASVALLRASGLITEAEQLALLANGTPAER